MTKISLIRDSAEFGNDDTRDGGTAFTFLSWNTIGMVMKILTWNPQG
jgi:hypothetical protein